MVNLPIGYWVLLFLFVKILKLIPVAFNQPSGDQQFLGLWGWASYFIRLQLSPQPILSPLLLSSKLVI